MTPLATLSGLVLACTSVQTGQVLPDFSLTDVNPASTSYGTAVSPREKLDKATAWYFGHST